MSKCPLTNCIRMCYVGFFLSVLEYVWELNCIPLNSWICLTAVYWYPTMCIVWGVDVDKGAVPQPCEEPQASWYSVPALGCHESCMPSWLRQHRGMYAIEVHTNAACIVFGAFSGQVGHLCVLYSPSGNSENSHTNSTAFHSQNVHLGKAGKERVDCRCGGWKADSACNPSDSCLKHVCWCWPYKTQGTRSQRKAVFMSGTSQPLLPDLPSFHPEEACSFPGACTSSSQCLPHCCMAQGVLISIHMNNGVSVFPRYLALFWYFRA